MNNIDLVLGQTLLVQVEEECVIGELTHVSSSRSFIRLSNVRDVTTNQLRGGQDYYSSEIRNIQILKEPPKDTDSILEKNGYRNKNEPALDPLQRRICYLDATLVKIQNYVFIHQKDVKYHDAIQYIRNQHGFGISMECIGDGRHAKSPSLLSIVTFRWIFIFDIKWLNMTKDVVHLFTDDRYRRVIHNGRLMKDVLQHCFGIVMGQCFDTMVAHIGVSKACNETTDDPTFNSEYSIQCCLEQYFKLPEKFFVVDVDFDERPMKHESKLEAAKRVAFLMDLQDHILHGIMLKKFYSSCEVYADSLATNADFVDSLRLLRNNRHEAIRAINPFTLDFIMK